MVTKSDNTQGNPYHADDGKFTSENGQGSSSEKQDKKAIQLKNGVDLNDMMKALQQTANANQPSTPVLSSKAVDVATPLTFPNSIQDAEMQGNRILGSTGAVGYADNTDLAVAHEFNKGLFDVCRDFPNLFNNEQLYLYGTADKRIYGDKQQVRNEEKVLISSVLSQPVYVNKLQNLQMSQEDIMNAMTLALHISKKTFRDDPKIGCGGFTKMSDYDDRTHTINTHNVIKFNTHYSTQIAKWDKYPKSSIAQGHFLPIGDKNGAYMVAVHELGHHVFEKLVDLMDDNEKSKLKSLVMDNSNPKSLQRKGEISGYATTSRHEHIAECFANVYCVGDNATNHNKKLFAFLKDVYKRIYDK